MAPSSPSAPDTAALDAFVTLVGARAWTDRLAALKRQAAGGSRAGRALLQRHAVELIIDALRRRPNRAASEAERRIAALAADAVTLADALTPMARTRLRGRLRAALDRDATLVPVFHLLRTAAIQRQRGFEVAFTGLEDDTSFDLLIARQGVEAEIACDVVSAEDGRDLHRGAWVRLADAIDPDLQTWLAAHPGRYLLKMTLPQGLRGGLPVSPERDAGEPEPASAEGPVVTLAALHGRIRAMLEGQRRSEQDAAVVLRLDPLLLAAAQADELGLMSSLRREFGPEAHLSVTAGGSSVFVMAARAGRENEVAVAVRRRMGAVAPARLSGTRPAILAMFIEDTDRTEWRSLRDRLELEGEARQFLTYPEARPIVAITCASRLELFGMPSPDAAPDGELRFRNQAHPAAKAAALAPSVLSSV